MYDPRGNCAFLKVPTRVMHSESGQLELFFSYLPTRTLQNPIHAEVVYFVTNGLSGAYYALQCLCDTKAIGYTVEHHTRHHDIFQRGGLTSE